MDLVMKLPENTKSNPIFKLICRKIQPILTLFFKNQFICVLRESTVRLVLSAFSYQRGDNSHLPGLHRAMG